MPQIKGFKGILYNTKKVNISNVVAPPYDVISPQMQDDLYNASEYNIIRLILGKEEQSDSKKSNKYKRAEKFFTKWLKDKILIHDKAPSVYVYSQEYFHGTKKKERLGFIACMKIEDPRKSRVLPHEYTFAKPKQDRLELIRNTKANLSPIFTLFYDNNNKAYAILKKAAKEKPLFDTKQEGVRHKLWRLKDKGSIKNIQKIMRGKEIYIADGHHRYEVALSYRDEQKNKRTRNKGYDYVMMYFSPLNQRGLTILSTHRLIKHINMQIKDLLKKLKVYFYVKSFKSAEAILNEMASSKKGEYTFGIYCKDKRFYLLRLKKGVVLDNVIKEGQTPQWKRLDVSILHGLILDNILRLRERIPDQDNIIYTRDPECAITMVDNGSCELTFFLNPTKIGQVKDIAKRGDRMPHKSTYFYPKLLSGLVINKLE